MKFCTILSGVMNNFLPDAIHTYEWILEIRQRFPVHRIVPVYLVVIGEFGRRFPSNNQGLRLQIQHARQSNQLIPVLCLPYAVPMPSFYIIPIDEGLDPDQTVSLSRQVRRISMAAYHQSDTLFIRHVKGTRITIIILNIPVENDLGRTIGNIRIKKIGL